LFAFYLYGLFLQRTELLNWQKSIGGSLLVEYQGDVLHFDATYSEQPKSIHVAILVKNNHITNNLVFFKFQRKYTTDNLLLDIPFENHLDGIR
jgi:hypothetical protein